MGAYGKWAGQSEHKCRERVTVMSWSRGATPSRALRLVRELGTYWVTKQGEGDGRQASGRPTWAATRHFQQSTPGLTHHRCGRCKMSLHRRNRAEKLSLPHPHHGTLREKLSYHRAQAPRSGKSTASDSGKLPRRRARGRRRRRNVGGKHLWQLCGGVQGCRVVEMRVLCS